MAENTTSKSKSSGAQPSYKLTVHETPDDKAKYIHVGVNGKVYQIEKGVEVEVGYEVIEVLKNAIKTTYHMGENGETIPTRMSAYPFSAVPI